MNKTYTLTAFEKGDFTDPHGNIWCTGVLQGIGEPVKMVVKDPSRFEAGMELFGEVKTVPTKKDPTKSYLRFYRAKPDEQQGFNNQGGGKPSRDDNHIRAQWAIGQSMVWQSTRSTSGLVKVEEIEVLAKELYSMVDRVKNSNVVTDSKVDKVYEPTNEELASLDKTFLEEIPY